MGGFIDRTGQRIGRWTVLRRGPNWRHGIRWFCRCDCGAERLVPAQSCYVGISNSCGCYQKERVRIRATRHGHSPIEGKSPTYLSWSAMIARCHSPNTTAFRTYGRLGISVTKPWRDSFASFLNDMGERPKGKTLDRIDNRFGYFASNCRWATRRGQAANKKPINKPAFMHPKLIDISDPRIAGWQEYYR